MILEYIYRWVFGWVQLGAGLATILSIGFYRPSWTLKFARLQAQYRISRNYRKL